MPTIFNEICEFIELETGYPKSRITKNTGLCKDIRIDGDDAQDFMESFALKFNVDMASFEFNHYFDVEGLDSISIVKSIFKLGKEKKIKDEITVYMLEMAAINKSWDKAC